MVEISMKKILKFDLNVKLISYPFYADYLGVLQAHNHNVDDILVNNLLTLYYTPKIQQVGFRNFKCLQKLMKIEALLLDYNDPIKSIKDYIDNNKYVEIVLNGKYLPFANVDKDKFHDWLIIGYDDDEKGFIGYGYTKNKEGINRYSKVFINYADFVSAVPDKMINTGFEKNIMYNHVFKIDTNKLSEKVNKNKIKRILALYIIPFPPAFFNISVFKRYESYLKKHNVEKVDLKNFLTLYEHSKILDIYIGDYLNISKTIRTAYQNIVVKKIYFLIIMAIKYNFTNDKNILSDICKQMNLIQKNEKMFIKTILKQTRKKVIFNE